MVFRLRCRLDRRRLTRIRISLRKNFFECGIVPIDVVVKMNDSILIDNRSAINDQNRNWMRKIHLLIWTSIHGRTDAIDVPPWIITQDPHS